MKANRLLFAGADAAGLAAEFGTPLYAYNPERIRQNFLRVKKAFEKHSDGKFDIHYAMKANANLSILKLLKAEGAKVDATSPQEAMLALNAGFKAEEVLFTGTSVSDDDFSQLIKSGVQINVDSVSQIHRLAKLGYKGKFSCRWNPGEGMGIGLNPNVITAGKFIKFGVPEHNVLKAYRLAAESGMKIAGLHQHLGSGWLGDDLPVFLKGVDKTIALAKQIEKETKAKLEFIDFGGGPGIPYRKEDKAFPIEEYAKGLCSKMKESGLDAGIKIEPGRYVVGDAGILLAEINTVEEKFVPIIGVNAGFNTLARPALYGSYHELLVCENVYSAETKEFLVAGNLCESTDVFTESKKHLRRMPVPKEGQTLAFLNAGAYGFAMASLYNLRPRPKEIFVEKGKAKVVGKGDSFDDLQKIF